MSIFSPFLFSKNWNYPPKIQILTNVNPSPPLENIKKLMMMFLFASKNLFWKGVFGFCSITFVVICYYTFNNKTVFLLSFFDPFKCVWALKQGHILNLLFKSRNKLWTPIKHIFPLNASTLPPKIGRKVAHVGASVCQCST